MFIILFAIIVPNYIVNVNDKLLCTAQLLPDDDPTKGKFLFVLCIRVIFHIKIFTSCTDFVLFYYATFIEHILIINCAPLCLRLLLWIQLG